MHANVTFNCLEWKHKPLFLILIRKYFPFRVPCEYFMADNQNWNIICSVLASKVFLWLWINIYTTLTPRDSTQVWGWYCNGFFAIGDENSWDTNYWKRIHDGEIIYKQMNCILRDVWQNLLICTFFFILGTRKWKVGF